MKFNKGVIKMQEQNPGYIILVRNGIFYTALGKDAVVLSKEFNQKLEILKQNMYESFNSDQKILLII